MGRAQASVRNVSADVRIQRRRRTAAATGRAATRDAAGSAGTLMLVEPGWLALVVPCALLPVAPGAGAKVPALARRMVRAVSARVPSGPTRRACSVWLPAAAWPTYQVADQEPLP